MQQKPPTHRSLEKALEILLAFRPQNPEMGTGDISEKTGFHKSTVSRLLHVLSEYDFLRQDPLTRKFSLGSAVVELGAAVIESLNNNLVHICKPYVDDLRDLVRETVVLEIPKAHYTVMAYVAEGPGPVRIKGGLGDRRFYHASAGAKAILAFSPRDFQRSVLSNELPGITPNTVTDSSALESELKDILERRLSFDHEGLNVGINAFGTPILDRENNPVAALVIAGSSQFVRWDERHRFVTPLMDTAARISAQFFHKGLAATSAGSPER